MKKTIFNKSILLILFLYLQPVLDVLYAVSNNILGFNVSINSIVRILFLVYFAIYILFINKDKLSRIWMIIISLYFLIFGISVFILEKNVLFYEFRNTISTFYFLVMFIYMYVVNKDLRISNKHFVYVGLIYLLLITIPNIFGIGFNTYLEGKDGSTGLFYSANAISIIIVVLLPVVISYFKDNKKYLLGGTYLLLMIYSSLSMGTKTPLIGILLVVSIYIIRYVISLFIKREYKKVSIIFCWLLITLVCVVMLLPKTTFYKNIIIHMNYFDIDSINDVASYTFVNNIIFSNRLEFLKENFKAYNDSNIVNKLFGLGYSWDCNGNDVCTKMVEIDYFDVFYRHGIIGFIVYFGICGYIFKMLFKTNKIEYKNICLLLVLLLSLFSGHVVTSASVSILLSYIFNIKKGGDYES